MARGLSGEIIEKTLPAASKFEFHRTKKSRKIQWKKVQVQAKKVMAPKPIPKLNLGFGCRQVFGRTLSIGEFQDKREKNLCL